MSGIFAIWFLTVFPLTLPASQRIYLKEIIFFPKFFQPGIRTFKISVFLYFIELLTFFLNH